MTKTNEKIHVLADESLGGIKREYVEVDRKAKEGEKIVIVDVILSFGTYHNGDVFGVATKRSASVRTACGKCIYDEEYRVLEPTNVVHIDGERYEMVDREAEVGEKVIYMNKGKSDGKVTEVTDVGAGMVDVIEYEDSDGEITCGFAHGKYRVLVPAEPQPSDPIDVIANLATRVAELERENKRIKDELDTLHKDNRRHGEELEALKYAAKETDGKVAHLESDSDMRLFTAEEVAALLNAMRERQ
ncbi:hypothetical protein [Bacillus licheniformis]|uniref:hypothetical protein n=1 Tax=Bacillus licheniformis TaxID=1402 RepID=UPI001C24FEEE|nr:hypothetical protein [Bacillus licheniformis]